MLSRIADSLFWTTRYMERTDCIVRMLRVNLMSSMERTGNEEFSWKSVLKIFTYMDDAEIEKIQYDTLDVLRTIITDKENQNSLNNIVTYARENARSVQDQIPIELWETINEFYLFMKNQPLIIDEGTDVINYLATLTKHCQMFYGTTDMTMPRGEEWTYMSLGKFLERSVQTAAILETKFGDISYDLKNPFEFPYWRYMLRSVAGYQLFLRTYKSGIQAQNIFDMMVFNVQFPRSVMYCLKRLEQAYSDLKRLTPDQQGARIDYKIGKLRSRVQYSDIETITEIGLDKFVRDITTDLLEIGSDINKYYFAYN